MQHPFQALKPEYSQLLSIMAIRQDSRKRVDEIAMKILGVRKAFDDVSKLNGVPTIFMGPSFYREADLDFALSPAQGDPWRKVSVHVPKGLGPYPSWQAAALAAYHVNGLDKVGAGNWSWELICYYAELFNGFGYRDYHHMHSPYLWGGTNIQTVGKYDADGKFDPDHMDEQLGVIPLARRIAEIATDLALPITIAPPIHSGIAAADTGVDTSWVQQALGKLGWAIPIDGSYGRETVNAIDHFQYSYGLQVDGIAGPLTIDALKKAIAELGTAA